MNNIENVRPDVGRRCSDVEMYSFRKRRFETRMEPIDMLIRELGKWRIFVINSEFQCAERRRDKLLSVI